LLEELASSRSSLLSSLISNPRILCSDASNHSSSPSS
jgi:hypothetical protein